MGVGIELAEPAAVEIEAIVVIAGAVVLRDEVEVVGCFGEFARADAEALGHFIGGDEFAIRLRGGQLDALGARPGHQRRAGHELRRRGGQGLLRGRRLKEADAVEVVAQVAYQVGQLLGGHIAHGQGDILFEAFAGEGEMLTGERGAAVAGEG